MGTIKVKNTDGSWIPVPIVANKILAGDVVQDSTHRFVTDTEKNKWDSNSGGGVGEAPTDGNQYTRGSRKWNKINIQDFALNMDLANKADKSELNNKADKVKRVNNDVTTLEIKPNTLYVWDEVTSLNITLANPTDSTIANEYMFQFTSGTQPTTLSLPSEIKWIGDNKIEASKTYQVSIVNNIAIMGGV